MSVFTNSAGRLLETFDHLRIPAFLVGGDLRVLSSNGAATSLFQFDPAELVGKDISDFVIPNNSGSSGRPFAEVSEASCESLCRKKNGDVFTALVSYVPNHEEGSSLVVIQDISDRKRLQERASQRTKELTIFSAFSATLTGGKSPEAMSRETLDILLPVMEADSGWVYLLDEGTGELLLQVHQGLSPGHAVAVSRLRPGECLSGKVLASGRPLLVKNASEDPRISYRSSGIESIVGVPVSSRGNVTGVIGIASSAPSFFTAMDIQLLSAIGSQLGVALENTRLIGQLQEKMRQIELINELSGIINSSLSIGTIFRIIVSEIRKLVGYSRASLLLYDEKQDNLLIFALDTEMKTVMKKGVKAPVEGTSAGWVVRRNRPWINYDMRRELRFHLDRKLHGEGILSTISIPLYNDKMLGVFNLDSTEPCRYSEKDLQVLLPAAKHISVALQNALLFEEINKEKREWEKTFDSIADMVWIEDPDRRVLRANSMLLAKSGFTSAEAVGRCCTEIFGRIGIAPEGPPAADVVAGRRPSFRELRASGGGIFYFWAYPLVDEEGELYAIVNYLKDVTAQKRLEQQLVRSDRLASLGTLVAGIAHEINNPLGIIAGYSEALLDRAGDAALRAASGFEDFPEYLETIHNEIFRCKGILGGLLDFARPSCGTFREIDINELIKEVILLVNHRAKKLMHNVELRLKRDLPKIVADPGSLRQLFMNLIINSIYFTPERGRIIICTDGLEAESPAAITVSVSDSGSGISADALGKIFDPFFTTKPVGEGAGLGLSICHKIVEEHGGSIDAESEPGRGTTFTIKLPTNAGKDQSTSC